MRIMRQLRNLSAKQSMNLTRADVKIGRRSEYSHKGDNGKVLVVGGSIDYVGAVLLAGMAAFRTGADLVVVAAPEKVAWAINTFSPDFITKKFRGDYFKKGQAAEIVRLSRGFDVVLIGNGAGLRKETAGFVREVVRKVAALKVIDADAIKVLKLSETKNAIITPHKTELAALMKHNRIRGLPQLRKVLGSNVLLIKGRTDVIVSKTRVAYNKTGNAGMTVGGTGDVLAGIAAGLLAQHKELFKSACAAAYTSGLIGNALLKEKGFGFIASDMLEKIPAAMKRVS